MRTYNILLISTIAFLFFFKNASSQIIQGKVMSEDSTGLPYATIYEKNTTYGVATDFKGNYLIQLSAGNHTLVFNYLGYEPFEKNFTLTKGEKITFNVKLKKSSVQIDEIEIVANKIDKAKKIMAKVRKKRKSYLNAVKNYECTNYVKTSIEKETTVIDSLLKQKDSDKDFKTFLKRENMNLIEYVAKAYFKRPAKYKEQIIAYHNFSEDKPIDFVQGGSISFDYGEKQIAPSINFVTNPFVFYDISLMSGFNFYKNLLEIPTLSDQPFVSPLAYNATAYYKFKFVTSFYENNRKIDKIQVIPRNNASALFYGHIFIDDSSSALVSVDLFVNEKILSFYKNFNIIQNYKQFGDSIFLPVRTDIKYLIKNGKKNILGYTTVIRDSFNINSAISPKIFSNEIQEFSPDAYDKDSIFWAKNRPIALKNKELNFIHKADSVQNYYLTDEYLDKRDSIYNRIGWWSPLFGLGHRNHYKGYQFYVGGIMQQIAPLGIGGYRHRLPLTFQQRFKNDMLLESTYYIDYGFNNHDLRGKLGLGLTYFPKKFVRTFVNFGNYYEMINTYAAFEQIFSRSNYVNTHSFSISQRMEIFNGLYAELTLEYSKQIPITNMQLSEWSNWLFGDINQPFDFEEYTKTEAKLELQYKIGQKYVIKKNRKIIIGDNYPEIRFTYRKGIPDLFNSEVNFDYLELGGKYEARIGRIGESRFSARIGWFPNVNNLRLLEYKFFRGSDGIIFSDPVTSLQLLPTIFYTNASFLQANYIHHFDGAIMNKVPLFKYLKLSLAIGAATLNIPDQNFYHIEFFGGIEKKFRIKTQKFRIGLYAVTADNTLNKASIKLKFGLSYYDDYNKRWNY